MSRNWQTVSRAIQNSQPACIRSRAKECSLTRLTMSEQPMKRSSDFTIREQRWKAIARLPALQNEKPDWSRYPVARS